MGPPPAGLGAPDLSAPAGPGGPPMQGGMPQPTSILAGLASALAAEVAQKEQAAQGALVTLASQLAAQPDPASAAAVSAPGPLTAAGSAPATDPNDPTGGLQ